MHSVATAILTKLKSLWLNCVHLLKQSEDLLLLNFIKISLRFWYGGYVVSFYKLQIIKAKQFYLGLGSIEYKALSITIPFNNKGFTHLLRKGKVLRKVEEQYQRCMLLYLVPKILFKIPFKTEHRKTNKFLFITTHTEVDGRHIKIVLRKPNNGQTHFFSIMERK